MIRFVLLALGLMSAILSDAVFWTHHPDAGRFRVDGAQIIGPDDRPFVPIGMNMLGPDGFFNPDAVTGGQAKSLADHWHVNAVRLNACLPEGCHYTGVHNHRSDNLQAIVDEYTRRHLVVILAVHEMQPGLWPDAAMLDRIDEWWHEQAVRFRHNPYVWFNLLNEPGHEKPAGHRWVDVHRRLLATVRAAGARNLVVVDGSSWGQDAGGVGATPVAAANSAILSYGLEVEGNDDAVAFAVHVYDQWGATRATDATRDARLTDFIDRIRQQGLAVLIGETGSPDKECCSSLSLATESAYRVARARRIGLLAWHGQGIDGYQLVSGRRSEPDAIDDADHPRNLTWQGRLLWNLTHAS